MAAAAPDESVICRLWISRHLSPRRCQGFDAAWSKASDERPAICRRLRRGTGRRGTRRSRYRPAGVGGRIIFVLILASLWLIGTVHAEPETVISRAWVQSPDPAE